MKFSPTSKFFKLMSRIERAAALAQGKGYGAITMEQEVSLLNSLLQAPARLAIDVGGNVGDYTAELRKLSPSLEIHTFEPSQINVPKLNSRFGSDPAIKIVPCALSNTEGETTLFADEAGSGMGSLTKRRLAHFGLTFNASEEIKTLRFEDYWRNQLQERQIDLVKIDVEGHEYSVLSGFGEALPNSKVVQFEFGGTDIDARIFLQDFWYLFASYDFEIYRFTPYGLQLIPKYMENEECFVYTNFVALNKSLP